MNIHYYYASLLSFLALNYWISSARGASSFSSTSLNSSGAIVRAMVTNEVDEVLEAGVEVVLQPQRHDVLEVRVVDVGVHAKQSLENYLDHAEEGLRKRNTYTLSTLVVTHLAGKQGFVVELVLHPGHQVVDVL